VAQDCNGKDNNCFVSSPRVGINGKGRKAFTCRVYFPFEAVMQTQFNVTSFVAPVVPKPAEVSMAEVSELLRQSLEVQRDQLTQMKQTAASQDAGARWRALMTKWREEFPEMPNGCKEALPILEKAYGSMVAALVSELQDQGPDALDSEFALQDFLDRYGMKLGQLGNILNVVGPLAEAAAQTEPAPPQQQSGNG
jgi:hypothetical protein